MKCPRCAQGLSKVQTNDVEIEVCDGGCGGIWFDWLELKKLDNPHEGDLHFLEGLESRRTQSPEIEKRLQCPKCPDITMMRHFYSAERHVEVDQCAQCGGFWLDLGELRKVRSLYNSDEERAAAGKALVEEMFGKDLALMQKESEEKAERAKAIANALKFLCPSYYIPGKQDGGAF